MIDDTKALLLEIRQGLALMNDTMGTLSVRMERIENIVGSRASLDLVELADLVHRIADALAL